MRVTFAPEAKAEFDDALCFYERQVPGLGKRSAPRCVMPCAACSSGRSPRRWNAATSGGCY